MQPAILSQGSIEFSRMMDFAAALNALNDGHYITYEVRNVYFNAGQDWKWTTIIADKKDEYMSSWQIFSPYQWNMVINPGIPLREALNMFFEDCDKNYKSLYSKVSA